MEDHRSRQYVDNSLSDETGNYSQSSPGSGQNQHGQQRYQFSQDELRALKECSRESFYYRCLPFGSILAAGTYYAVKLGHLKPSARFGALPKVFAAGFTGYVVGKFSYQKECVEKIMALPNSRMAEMLKQQRAKGGTGGKVGNLGFGEMLTMEPGFNTAVTSTTTPSSEEAFSSSSYYTDVSDTRPLVDSYDTSEFQGSYRDNEIQMGEDTLPPKPPQYFTSYDELRRHNRDDYDKRISGSSLQGTGDRKSGSTRSQSQQSNPTSNSYGDIWDDRPGN